MKTRGIIHICLVFALLLMAACATVTTEGDAEREKPQKCYENRDCPSGFRCNVKSSTCERSF